MKDGKYCNGNYFYNAIGRGIAFCQFNTDGCRKKDATVKRYLYPGKRTGI